ncbi:MAG: hypothetical protein WC269_00565, partial [Candidatus Gracilibacteria bacterium]
REEGAGVLSRRALEKIASSGHNKWVVDGIRNPAEVDELRKGKDVHILGVNASKDILVDRILSRSRESDAKEKAEILRKIEREWGVGEPEDGQQVEKCMQKVDLVIDNEGTLEELGQKFTEFYNKINK